MFYRTSALLVPERKVKELVAQSCPTLCDPIDRSPLGSSVHGISRQEYWSGLSFPPLRDIPDPGIEPFEPSGKPGIR